VTIIRMLGARIVLSMLTLLIVSIIIFALLEVLPGDVASRILGRDATPEALALLRAKLNLNEPAMIRYLHWLGGIVQGDFGRALTSSRPISEILAPRLFNSAILSLYAFLIYIPLSLIPALIQASRRDREADHVISVINSCPYRIFCWERASSSCSASPYRSCRRCLWSIRALRPCNIFAR
jgi:peptide/nickel transport system permease protein